MSSSSCLWSVSQRAIGQSTHKSIASPSLFAAHQTACFSTSAARHAQPVAKKKGMIAPPKRGTKTLNVKKGRKDAIRDLSKRPGSGERKAQRKRIVLSNNNALDVLSLKDLSKADALSSENQGLMKGIPDVAVDALRAVEAFKPSQGWSLFKRPAVLMRKEAIQLAQLLQEAEAPENGGAKKTVRRVLFGDKMSGKSTLLLQSLLMAHLRGWVIINLPEAQDLVNAHTEYAPLPEAQPAQYTQDVYTANLLSQILKANETILKTIKLKTQPSLPLPLPSGSTLIQLIQLGIANPEASWPVFTALWKEFTQPGRPPILLALDNLAHVMRESEYISPEVKPIHAHDLTLVRHFVDHLSGKAKLPNGGAVIGAMSASNSPTVPAVDFSIQLAQARQAKQEKVPLWNPYKIVDQRVMESLKDVDVIKVGGLSKEEARSIMEYYAESGLLRAKVSDGFISERWSLAGMGNIGELERNTVRLRV